MTTAVGMMKATAVVWHNKGGHHLYLPVSTNFAPKET